MKTPNDPVGITAAFIRPARQFSFTVDGVLPPTILTDRDAKLFLVAVRNILLTIIAGAVTNVPTEKMLEDIKLSPWLGAVNQDGSARA